MIRPSLDEFEQLAERFAFVPVELKVLGDSLTPIALYAAIKDHSRYSFLLESVQGGEARARYSFLGSAPREVFGTQGEEPFFCRAGESPLTNPPEALSYLREIGRPGQSPEIDGMPPFVGGSVGYIAYDAVSAFGDVERTKRPGLSTPEMFFMTFDRILCFDHLHHTLSLIVNVPTKQDRASASRRYARAVDELHQLYRSLNTPGPLKSLSVTLPKADVPIPSASTFGRESFMAAVEKVKEYIRAGDIFQGVLSQRFAVPIGSAEPLDIYRVLRFLNPSPYMYCLDFGSFHVVGTSPEALVKLSHDTVEVRPIAGTRRRGSTPDEDQSLEEELRHDPKELAEHIMLVDLGRNDVGRVSQYGTVQVTELMTVERYSHVMHLVSNVKGLKRTEFDPVDVFAAAFPAGTVTGAPKIRAMQIIDELEPEARGLYAGGIGYFSFTGQMDSCIAIRTMVIKDGTAYIQGGGGIVADSDPGLEYQETVNKTRVLVQAIACAQAGSGTGG